MRKNFVLSYENRVRVARVVELLVKVASYAKVSKKKKSDKKNPTSKARQKELIGSNGFKRLLGIISDFVDEAMKRFALFFMGPSACRPQAQ